MKLKIFTLNLFFLISTLFSGIWESYVTERGFLKRQASAFEVYKGKMYFARANGGLTIYDGENALFMKKRPGGLLSNYITVVKKRKKELWIGTNKGLVLYFNKTWKYFTKEQGLYDNFIIGIDFDSTNRVIVANKYAINIGVKVNKEYRWQAITPWQGFFPPRIYSLKCDKNGVIWLGTDKGLWAFNGKKWFNFNKNKGLISSHIYDIEIDDIGRLWVCGYDFFNGGIGVWDGSEWKQYRLGKELPKLRIYDISIRNNVVWAATSKGILKLDKYGVHMYRKEEGVLPDKIIKIITTKDNIYFRGYTREKAFVGKISKEFLE